MSMAPSGQAGVAIWVCASCDREFDPLASEFIPSDCPIAEFSGLHRLNLAWVVIPDIP